MTDYHTMQARHAARHDRIVEFIEQALETGRPPRDDWRMALADAVTDLDRIATRDNHPDDTAQAQLAMQALAGLWLTVEEREQMYMQGEHLP